MRMKTIHDLKQKSGILFMTTTMETMAKVMMCSLSLKPFLCDYSDAYILVTGDIKVAAANNNTTVAIKNCHPFTRACFKLNDEQVHTADNLDLTMELYIMLEYRP